MSHPVPTKGFLQLSPEAAMLSGPCVEIRPPPPVLSFLLAQNLSPKDFAKVTSQAESCMTHMGSCICMYIVIG